MNRTLWIVLLLACGGAHAALGDKPGEGPAATVRRSSTVTGAGSTYSEVSRTLSTGAVVREYADASGTVFAVAWSGPYKPNLKQLLGSHFDAFRQAASGRERRASRSRLQVDTGELVVESAGYMEAFTGKAWLPSRVPAGFDLQEMS